MQPETILYTRKWLSAEAGTAELSRDQQLSVSFFSSLCNEYDKPFVIDVGSHVGTRILISAARKPLCGWAFEPHSAVCDVLRQNLATNGMSGAFRVFQKALSHFPGRRVLKSPCSNKDSALSCLGQPNYSPYQEQYVDVCRLDDIEGIEKLAAIDIISVDTEGSELFMLIGAAETISRHKPDILTRVNWANLNQMDVYINNLTDYLELLGYQGHWVGSEYMLFRHPYRRKSCGRPDFSNKSDNSGLKVAIVKQIYDVFGPWRSEKYDHGDPTGVVRKWPSKYSYVEMTHLFRADWFVLPFCHDSKIVRQKIDQHLQTFENNAENVTHVADLSLDDYDVVISLDPILRPPRNGKPLYAYFQNEHHHNEYSLSIRTPMPGYDLFLDHVMKSSAWVYRLPQSVAFPYPRDPFVMRGMCSSEPTGAIWFDKRFVMMLAHGNETFHQGGFEKTTAFLEKKFAARIIFRDINFDDMTCWGDPINYIHHMTSCTYYVNLIACGAGQGLCDAASLGLICFGSSKLPYHRSICHPHCLCANLSELELKFAIVRTSKDLRQEILAWQDSALSDVMVRNPVRIIQEAVELKRRQLTNCRSTVNQIITELTVCELSQEPARINCLKLKQRAQEEYERGSYEESAHTCRQILWFDASDYQALFMSALAYYAANDKKMALERVTECLNVNDQFNPARTLKQVLRHEYIDDGGLYERCRSRVLYLINNRFNGFDRVIDGGNISTYNNILGELIHHYMLSRDVTNQLLVQHHKIRLNQLADLL